MPKDVCGYHDQAQRVLAELNTSSKWLVRLMATAIVMGVPVAISFFVYLSKLETRVVTLERSDIDIMDNIKQIKNQRNMDHKHSGFQLQ